MPDLVLPAPLAPAASTALDRPPSESPAAVYLAALSKQSQRTMRQSLDTIAALLGDYDALTCPWAALRYQHTAAIRAALADTYAPATANKMLAALKRVLEEAWRLGQLDAEAYRRAVDLRSVRGETIPAGRALARDEVTALLDACARDTTQAGIRDGALIATLLGTGLRRFEAVALDLADYTPATGELLVRKGKGRKGRIVYVAGGARSALDDYLTLRGVDAGPLFVSTTHAGMHRLTDQAVWKIVQKRAGEAQIAHLSPHDFRRTFITSLLDAGEDLSTVQKLAGHAKTETTIRYDRRGETAKQAAVARLDIPYTRRTLPLDPTVAHGQLDPGSPSGAGIRDTDVS